MSERLAPAKMYQTVVAEYKTVVRATAEAKSEFTHQKAKFKVIEKFNSEERISDAELENRAHADDKIAALYNDFLVKEATEKSYKAKLDELKESSANWRMETARERDIDKMHAGGWSGAA